MKYDFNILERVSRILFERGKYRDALRVYYFMSDGDLSLDGGYLGERIGECYEALGELQAARFWYGRAVEENPEVGKNSVSARDRLTGVSIDDLLVPENLK